jgi:predicted GH43/DUF377 family glycosyl hydrolase
MLVFTARNQHGRIYPQSVLPFVAVATQRRYQGRGAIGWLILDQKNPLKVLDRAQAPIVFPEHAWEAGGAGLQTPWVTFADGLQALVPRSFCGRNVGARGCY